MNNHAILNTGSRFKGIRIFLLFLSASGILLRTDAVAVSHAMMTEWKTQVALIQSLETRHEEICSRIDTNHDYMQYLFLMNEPPRGQFIVEIGDGFPVLLNENQISKLAYRLALQELVADNPSAEARKWLEIFSQEGGVRHFKCDTPVFWGCVLARKHQDARGKLKGVFQKVWAQDQQDLQELHAVTDQIIAAEKRLQELLAQVAPPRPINPALPAHERQFQEYMNQTQALLDANWRRLAQDLARGKTGIKKTTPPKFQPQPRSPAAVGREEPVNPTIGRELEERLKKMDEILNLGGR